MIKLQMVSDGEIKMDFLSVQYAEQHRLAKEARAVEFTEQKPGLSFPISLLDSLIPHPQPEPNKKPIRRPA
jgi:hypothetical protein